jgi:ribosomal protein L23
MNKIEIRDYLQNIYKVPVAKVHTHIQMGTF